MATVVPGFSVSELIIAAGHFKTIYEAFFNKHTNSATQIRYLAETIEEFKTNLETHRVIIEERGLEYGGYQAIERTLAECTDLLKKYKTLLEDKKLSAERAYKTARYAYEQDVPKRLREQIAHHYHTLHFSMNAIIMDSLRTSNLSSHQRVIAHQSTKSISPPPETHLSSETHQYGQDILSSSSSIAGSMSERTKSWEKSSTVTSRQRQDSVQRSPRSRSIVPYDQNFANSILPELGLPDPGLTDSRPPDPGLLGGTAKLYFGSEQWIKLKRKVTGGDIPKVTGRELVMVTEKGTQMLKHQIKLPPKQSCYPYTWHSCWGKTRELEVTFVAMPVESHCLRVKGQEQTLGTDIPRYVFTNSTDYKLFQGEVRGKELVAYFEFRQIITESSSNYGEATDQHLKIWKHRISQDHSISFFASAAQKTGDLEFPISMFHQQIDSKEELKVDLYFIIARESTSRQTKSVSRSATATTTASSQASFDYNIFSRVQTSFSAATSITSTMTSRNSIASFGSDGSPPQLDKSKRSLTVVEEQARRMKRLNIEFSDAEQASRFRRVYDQVYTEESTRLSELFLEWRLGVDADRPRSSISNASIPETPMFTMSPIIGSQQSPELRPHR